MTANNTALKPRALTGRTLQRVALVGLLGLSLAGFEATARASYIVNGTFDTGNTGFGTAGGGITTGSDYTGGGTLGSWTVSDVNGSSGLAFMYVSGNQGSTTTAGDGIGQTGRFGGFSVYDPGNIAGATPTGGAIPNTSPGGGNFIVADGAVGYQIAMYQTLTDLTAGTKYNVSFWYAAGQQYNFSGTTTEGWQVSLLSAAQMTVASGTGIQDTPTQANVPGTSSPGLANGSFQAWAEDTMQFTATSSSQVLTFLSLGTPSGQPPVDFLSDVVLTASPEPASLAMFGIGMAGLFSVVGFRRSRSGRNRAVHSRIGA
jgi:hypothetical protein